VHFSARKSFTACCREGAEKVGTAPVGSNWCIQVTPPTAVSAAVRNKATDRVQEAAAEEQLSITTIHPTVRTQLQLPALDFSWAMNSLL